MSTIKQGSVMEGIFAMYCAAYLIDPADGQNKKSIENFIDDLRVDTTSVSYTHLTLPTILLV